MAEFISRHGYYHVKNFISKELASYLANIIQTDRNNGAMAMSDNQVPGAAYRHNSVPIKTMLLCLQDNMSMLSGKKLEPTYCYTRIYYQGNILEPHRDRGSCEYSVTVHLAGSHDWPIYVEDLENGKCKGISLRPGEAVVYRGCDVLHYRKPYEGDWYIQTFLHYVDSEGPHKELSIIEKKLPQITSKLPPFVKLYENQDTHIYDLIKTHFKQEQIPCSKNTKYFITAENLQLAQNITDNAIQNAKAYSTEYNVHIHCGAHDVLILDEYYHSTDEPLFGFTLLVLWVIEGSCRIEFPDYECQITMEKNKLIVLPASFAYMYTIKTNTTCSVFRSFLK